MAQTVKRLPTIWETWVRLLVGEDPLEKSQAGNVVSTAARPPGWAGGAAPALSLGSLPTDGG